MKGKKYHKQPTGAEKDIICKPLKYDSDASMKDLYLLFDLVRIKFENHLEIVKSGNGSVNTSLNAAFQQFNQLFKIIERLNV
jgi:hypothetical protein